MGDEGVGDETHQLYLARRQMIQVRANSSI